MRNGLGPQARYVKVAIECRLSTPLKLTLATFALTLVVREIEACANLSFTCQVIIFALEINVDIENVGLFLEIFIVKEIPFPYREVRRVWAHKLFNLVAIEVLDRLAAFFVQNVFIDSIFTWDRINSNFTLWQLRFKVEVNILVIVVGRCSFVFKPCLNREAWESTFVGDIVDDFVGLAELF